jgi:ATP-dependent exoDNAse (exonuclease V) alpha subunit
LEDHRVRVFESNFDEQQSMKMQRSLIYVAMTRAMDMLNVFTLAEPTSPVIKDLKTILEQE